MKSESDFGTDHLALSCPIGISVSLTVIGPNTFSTFNVPVHDFLKTVAVVPDVPDEYATGADANIFTVPGAVKVLMLSVENGWAAATADL
ncbi:hypothetical protein T01_2674 [Trichinella spiralis]|uniref:Uncharacterized protein n=1 Tax=Trichinella spiralis TaxID=6334 RepID=A0A0V1AIM4_TRISP|nr:hypothetical protein T01_2674 [Trichinella spiralis]